MGDAVHMMAGSVHLFHFTPENGPSLHGPVQSFQTRCSTVGSWHLSEGSAIAKHFRPAPLSNA